MERLNLLSCQVQCAAANLFVVDDFYEDPASIRSFALNCEFRRSSFTVTDALVSTLRHPAATSTLQRIGEVIGVAPNLDAPDRMQKFWGYTGCGEFQVRLKDTPKPGWAHSHNDGEWVGLVYLTSPEHCGEKIGTYLLEHKKLKVRHFNQVEGYMMQQLKLDSPKLQDWNVVAAPRMKFNRLVVFDSRHFHAESGGFGKTVEDGRIVQVFNFRGSALKAM
ncbi:hypothetical protein [Pseudomonas reactans]|uniref:hypothetical protein n=1 Tax=Pseudomonas reactans TaxID=117680 RepID=UPI0015A0623A|nr:hypothetical protein [Pseudomonas reactans]NWA67716.1 hypothetical protein [Pseudomonas reactans]